jgi:hypothetical protein
MAGSLGVGLDAVAPKYDALVANEGIPGCSLAMDKASVALIFAGPPAPPCQASNPNALFDAWEWWVEAWNPDVVLYLARGEVLNQRIGTSTSWMHIGEPSFDTRLSGRISQALQVLESRGAHVFLLGSPLYDSSVLAEGQSSSFPEDNPARVATDDALMQAAVAGDPGASFLDLGAWLSPAGRYTATVDGLDARCSDGVHLTPAGGEWVANQLFPLITSVARNHHQQAPEGAWPDPTLPGNPTWYVKLAC